MSYLQEPPPDNMTEERRRELIELGFPDDGYDYLKHMRAPGRGGRANLEGPGPASAASAGECDSRLASFMQQIVLHERGCKEPTTSNCKCRHAALSALWSASHCEYCSLRADMSSSEM